LKPNSLLAYLFHIAKYFGGKRRQNLEKHTMRARVPPALNDIQRWFREYMLSQINKTEK